MAHWACGRGPCQPAAMACQPTTVTPGSPNRRLALLRHRKAWKRGRDFKRPLPCAPHVPCWASPGRAWGAGCYGHAVAAGATPRLRHHGARRPGPGPERPDGWLWRWFGELRMRLPSSPGMQPAQGLLSSLVGRHKAIWQASHGLPALRRCPGRVSRVGMRTKAACVSEVESRRVGLMRGEDCRGVHLGWSPWP